MIKKILRAELIVTRSNLRSNSRLNLRSNLGTNSRWNLRLQLPNFDDSLHAVRKKNWHPTIFLTTKIGGKRYTELGIDILIIIHIKFDLKFDLNCDVKLDLMNIILALRNKEKNFLFSHRYPENLEIPKNFRKNWAILTKLLKNFEKYFHQAGVLTAF